MKLTEALKLVDPTNDAHWTTDGSVRLDVVKTLMGEAGVGLTRELFMSLQPGFKRNSPLAINPEGEFGNVESEEVDSSKPSSEQTTVVNETPSQQPSSEKSNDTVPNTVRTREVIEAELVLVEQDIAKLNGVRSGLMAELDSLIIEEDKSLVAERPPILQYLDSRKRRYL